MAATDAMAEDDSRPIDPPPIIREQAWPVSHDEWCNTVCAAQFAELVAEFYGLHPGGVWDCLHRLPPGLAVGMFSPGGWQAVADWIVAALGGQCSTPLPITIH